jgi:hypothetical protein
MTGVSRIICLDLNKVFPTPNGGMLALVLAIGVIVAACCASTQTNICERVSVTKLSRPLVFYMDGFPR